MSACTLDCAGCPPGVGDGVTATSGLTAGPCYSMLLWGVG